MSQTAAAIAITAVIKQIIADHTAYVLNVEQDNRAVIDVTTQNNPWLKVEIRMGQADQLDLADHPRVEQWGQIWLTAKCKPGTGGAGTKALIDFVTPYFELKQLGPVVCKAVAAVGGAEVKGVWGERAIVNFYLHRAT